MRWRRRGKKIGADWSRHRRFIFLVNQMDWKIASSPHHLNLCPPNWIFSQSQHHVIGFQSVPSALPEATAVLPSTDQQVEAVEVDGRFWNAARFWASNQSHPEKQHAKQQQLQPIFVNFADGKTKSTREFCSQVNQSSSDATSTQESNAIFCWQFVGNWYKLL